MINFTLNKQIKNKLKWKILKYSTLLIIWKSKNEIIPILIIFIINDIRSFFKWFQLIGSGRKRKALENVVKCVEKHCVAEWFVNDPT